VGPEIEVRVSTDCVQWRAHFEACRRRLVGSATDEERRNGAQTYLCPQHLTLR
jgi:hypothetical protein